jgi:8-oxo-dGTP diphosphatase
LTEGRRRVVVGAAIVRDGLLLAQRRAVPARLAGRWELPGGRVEPGESELAALRRECQEELGARITVLGRVGVDVPLPGSAGGASDGASGSGAGAVLRVYSATMIEGSPEPRALEHAGLRWVSGAELAELDWLDADRVLLPDLATLLG